MITSKLLIIWTVITVGERRIHLQVIFSVRVAEKRSLEQTHKTLSLFETLGGLIESKMFEEDFEKVFLKACGEM